jgi:hypothetical protein
MKSVSCRALMLCASFASVFICAVLLSPAASIAQETHGSETIYWQPSQIPILFHGNYSVLGDRHQKPGNERIMLRGVLTNSLGSNPAQVIIEIGGKARVDVPNKSVRFDGKMASSGITSGDEDILESIVDDLPETLIEATALGGGFRLIGQRFKSSNGELCNIYDAWTPVKSNSKRQRPYKRYCFDSNTMLLLWVQYRDGTDQKASFIETRYSEWIFINGQAVPGKIQKTRDGINVFVLETDEVSLSSSKDDSIFKP